jgi:hypothetical protein
VVVTSVKPVTALTSVVVPAAALAGACFWVKLCGRGQPTQVSSSDSTTFQRWCVEVCIVMVQATRQQQLMRPAQRALSVQQAPPARQVHAGLLPLRRLRQPASCCRVASTPVPRRGSYSRRQRWSSWCMSPVKASSWHRWASTVAALYYLEWHVDLKGDQPVCMLHLTSIKR